MVFGEPGAIENDAGSRAARCQLEPHDGVHPGGPGRGAPCLDDPLRRDQFHVAALDAPAEQLEWRARPRPRAPWNWCRTGGGNRSRCETAEARAKGLPDPTAHTSAKDPRSRSTSAFPTLLADEVYDRLYYSGAALGEPAPSILSGKTLADAALVSNPR